MSAAIASVKPQHTGTGLYDTILAAYTAARDHYAPGTSNQIMVFTDGINADDRGSISRKELVRRLERAKDPRRPVQLSVVGFGKPAELQALGTALAPVGAYVEPLQSAPQVEAMSIHWPPAACTPSPAEAGGWVPAARSPGRGSIGSRGAGRSRTGR